MSHELSALHALYTLRNAALDVFGDPEDCDDCSELRDNPCRIHGPTSVAMNLCRAIEAAEDAIGPCRCGHVRTAHQEDEARPCKSCHCRSFQLPDPTPTTHLGQAFVSRVTESDGPELSVIGATDGSMPTTAEAALHAIVALDFKKDGRGRDDFYSGPDRFVTAWTIAAKVSVSLRPIPESR